MGVPSVIRPRASLVNGCVLTIERAIHGQSGGNRSHFSVPDGLGARP